MNLDSIQRELRAAGLDGWLFFDHQERDPLACWSERNERIIT